MENLYVNDKCPSLASYSATVSEQRDQDQIYQFQEVFVKLNV
jgi:hypothetical protein